MTINDKRTGLFPTRGFTVMEMIIAISIFTFIAGAMYGVLATGRRSWLTGEALVTTQASARIALDRITRELHHSAATHVTINNTLFGDTVDSVRFDIPIDADSDGFLDLFAGSSLLVYGADDAGDFDGDGQLWEQGWEIEFQRDVLNEQIIRRVLDITGAEASRQIMANDVSSLDIRADRQTPSPPTVRIPNDAVNIGITAQRSAIQGRTINPPIETVLRTRVNFRN